MDKSAISNPQSALVFSQSSLQDYVDCRRRFQLRYLLKVQWPALESQPALENERAMQQGAQFHRLVQQHLLGIPAERLTPLAQGDELARWWGNYLVARDLLGLKDLTGLNARPEMTLAASLNGHRLIAKYDLLITHPDGHLTIYDWKTSPKKPKRQWLLERLQTRVYLYVLAKATGDPLPASPIRKPRIGEGQPPPPKVGSLWGRDGEGVEMLYWYAEDPLNPEKIPYSPEKFAADEAHLSNLIGEITSLAPENFHLTADEKRCQFCTYRSLCNRGVQAGNMNDMDEAPEPAPLADFDFEQIAEIAF
jgi:hypothetical protein